MVYYHTIMKPWKAVFTGKNLAVRNVLGLDQLEKQSIQYIKNIKERIEAKNIVQMIDYISDSVCSVVDLAEFLAHNHKQKQWRDKGAAVSNNLQQEISFLNTDKNLFRDLTSFINSPSFLKSSQETRLVAKSFHHSFFVNGAKLSSENKGIFNRASIQEQELCLKYLNSVGKNQERNARETAVKLISTRTKKANLLGYSTFADLALSEHELKNSRNVHYLLNSSAEENMLSNTSETLFCSEGYQLNLEKSITIKEMLMLLEITLKKIFSFDISLEKNEHCIFSDDAIWVILKNKDENVGFCCLDLFHRNEKTLSPATFQLQASHKSNNYSAPVCALVTSFARSIFSRNPFHINSLSTLLKQKITLQDAILFFHEFGHVLHCLLPRTQYQHLSGTRCTTDQAEIPSTLFEQFLCNYSIFRSLHGDETAKSFFVKARDTYSVKCFLQREVEKAKFDLDLHCVEERFLGDVIEEGRLKGFQVENFPHLVDYPASYYSYVFAKQKVSQKIQDALNHDSVSKDEKEQLLQLQHSFLETLKLDEN
eukprot:snap_masked-scaffold_13-processed-gene-10.32-mRNA-1 protein AED:1.00 eAED:1.00 QI:0/-1/0/0/-1/1/1/0/538